MVGRRQSPRQLGDIVCRVWAVALAIASRQIEHRRIDRRVWRGDSDHLGVRRVFHLHSELIGTGDRLYRHTRRPSARSSGIGDRGDRYCLGPLAAPFGRQSLLTPSSLLNAGFARPGVVPTGAVTFANWMRGLEVSASTTKAGEER